MHAAAADVLDDDTADRRKLTDVGVVFGTSGTRMSGGQIVGAEHNAKLRGRALIERAEYMRRTDPMVGRVLRLVDGTTTSVTYGLTGGVTDTEFGMAVNRFCHEQMGFGPFSGRGKLRRRFDRIADPFHDFWYYGRQYGEVVPYADRDASGVLRQWIGDILHCEPTAHDQWLTDDYRTLKGVLQRQVNWGETVEPIPAGWLWLCTWKQTGSNWDGQAVARLMSWWVQAKEDLGIYWLRESERLGNGVWRARLLYEVLERLKMSSDDDEVRTKHKDLTEALTKVSAGKPGATIRDTDWCVAERVGANDLKPHAWVTAIQEADQQIASTMGANFALLGQHDTGSRAVGAVHGSFFRRGCVEVVDQLVDSFTDGPLRKIVELNFGPEGVAVMPRLRHIGLDVDKLADGIQVIPQLEQVGLLHETEKMTVEQKETVRAVRQTFGLTAGGPTARQSLTNAAISAIGRVPGVGDA